MVLSQEYLDSVSGTHGDSHVRPLEMEIVNLKRQIQANKQSISQHKYQLDSGVETLRPGDVSAVKTRGNVTWEQFPFMHFDSITIQTLFSCKIIGHYVPFHVFLYKPPLHEKKGK